jgi:hypothetical protein
MKRRTVFLLGEPWCAASDNPALTDGGQHNAVTGTKSGQRSGKGF